MDLLIRNGLFLMLDVQDRILDGYDMFIQNSQIARIGKNLDTGDLKIDRVIDASEKLVIPGLVNAHLHSDENLFKGCFDNLPLELWMLYRDPPASYGTLGSELIYLRTLLGAMEMLKTGITTIMDDCVYPSGSDPGSVDAVFQAYTDSGLRSTVAFGVTDRHFLDKFPYLRQDLPKDIQDFLLENRPRTPAEEYIKLYENILERWHGRENGRIRVGLSPSAPQRCYEPFLRWMIETSNQRNLPLNVHIQETKMQVITGWEFYNGRTVMQYAHDIGLLTPRTSVNHSVWVTDEEIEMMALDGVTVIHLPISNLRIGSGIMPMHKMVASGLNIALGTDGASSNDNQNMFEVMKMAAMLQKITQPDYKLWPDADQILRMATGGGAHGCLLESEIGSLEEGKKADLVLLSKNRLPFIPLNDVKNQLVYCEQGQSVDTVIIDGRIIVEKGQLVYIDEQDVLRQLEKVHKDFISNWRSVLHYSDQLKPYMADIYWNCVRRDVGINRWAEDRWN